MNKFEQRAAAALEARDTANSRRVLHVMDSEKEDFFSNDYLGLARWSSGVVEEGGSTGSRLLSGHSEAMAHLEAKICAFHKAEAALLFNSGYQANLGILSTVAQRGDIILYDALSHASIRDALRLTWAKSYRFAHNSMHELEALLQKYQGQDGQIFIVVESVYSMDGDEAPLWEITALAERYGALLIVDEAHGVGVLGVRGEGAAANIGAWARIVTYGKAFGAHGAAVLGDELLRDYLINFSRPLIYTTALDRHSIARLAATYEYLECDEGRQRQIKLRQNIEYFQTCVAQRSSNNFLQSDTAIQGFRVSGNSAARALAQQLSSEGFEVRAILSPTVPEGEERLRICLHSYNTKAEIRRLVERLQGVEFDK